MSDLWSWLNPRSTVAMGRDWIRSSKPALTAEDVKHALGGLRDAPFLFGMAAFLGDPRSTHRLEAILVDHLVLVSDAEGWCTKRQHFEVVQRMGALMLFEVLAARSRAEALPGDADARQRNVAHVRCPACIGKGTAQPCTSCAGAGRVVDDERRGNAVRFMACDHCRGTGLATARCSLCGGAGRFTINDARRAQAVQVHKANWMRTWAGRYAEHIELPRRWEHAAVSHVRRRLQ